MLDFFIRKSLKSGLKRNNRNRKFLNYDGIQNILILFDIQDWEKISPIIEDLKQNNKNVILWTIKPNPDQVQIQIPELPKDVNIIDLKTDLDWKRTIKKEIISKFENVNYDTFMDLTVSENSYSQLLLIQNKSNFCLGFKENEEKLYDFVILKDENQDFEEAYHELKKYLIHIK